ncbi:hypothetical protein WJR50_25470 [Catalinimonas sp. 4WD22]|uniref:hypothetical protein n=1 Tax=Catalinimonas locisalis TaxID=3133978 RepID=UPI0031012BD0
MKGISVEYGVQPNLDELYSIGYQAFLSKRFQIEISGGYEQGNFTDVSTYGAYQVTSEYGMNTFMLNETIDYSFLKLFRHVYFSIGAGLTQTYQEPDLSSIRYKLDSSMLDTSEEVPEFDQEEATLNEGFTLGGHANILTEVYLSRYFTLLARYRYTYFLKNHYDQQVQQATLGIRFNF